MLEEKRSAEEKDRHDANKLEDVEGEQLPDREVMSVIGTGWDDPMPLPAAEPADGGEEPAKTPEEPLKGGEQL